MISCFYLEISMNDADIKLNLIIKKLNHLEQIVKILINDHNPNLIIDLNHINQDPNQSDHKINDQSDQDNLEWYQNFLRDSGIDPDHRDYSKIQRNIAYFRNKFPDLANPTKYGISFLPKQIKPTSQQGDKQDMDENGFTISYLMERLPELTDELIEITLGKSERIKGMLDKAPRLRKTAMFKTACLSEALRLKLIT